MKYFSTLPDGRNIYINTIRNVDHYYIKGEVKTLHAFLIELITNSIQQEIFKTRSSILILALKRQLKEKINRINNSYYHSLI